MTTIKNCVRAALSRFSARATALCVAALAVVTIGSLTLTVPASGSPSRADALLSPSRPVAHHAVAAAGYVAAEPVSKAYPAAVARAAQQAATRAAYEHWFHENHVRQLAARQAAAQAASRAVAAAAPAAHPAVQPGVPFAVTSSFQQCVIQRESGGNPQIWNASGHWGLYQFSYSTWVAHGGPAADFGHVGAAEQTRIFWATVAVDGTSDWAPYDGCGGSVSAPATTTAVVTASGSLAARAFAIALTQQGHWYCWGGNGTSANGFGCPAGTFDCSGLVMWAYGRLGVSLPHNTGAMLASGKLTRTYAPAKGDLAFYGTGHVELYAGGNRTFGAHQTGQRIGYVTEWEAPVYYRVA